MRIEWHFVPPFRQLAARRPNRAASVEKRGPEPQLDKGRLALCAAIA